MTTVSQEAEKKDKKLIELSDEELIAECRGRANIYRLLAGMLIEEPTREYLEAVRSPAVMASLRQLGVEFGKDFTEPPIEELEQTIAYEYGMLFVVTGGCPAVESVRLTGRYQQQPYWEIREIYAKAGFKVKPKRFAVFEDQLGVQLNFLAEMLERSAAALEAGNRAEYVRLTKEIKRFWALHPGKWVRGYATLLAQASEHSFFIELAKLLGRFAQWELDLLGVKVDDVDGGKLDVPLADIEYEFDPNEPVCNACGNNPSEEIKTVDISQIRARVERKN